MNYEKKYKSLVEAVKTLKEANPSDEGIQKWIKDNVPELVESEDERISNAIICYITDYSDGHCMINVNGVTRSEAVAWLEKQGEHKPIEWSEEDKLGLQNTIALIQGYKDCNDKDEYCVEGCDYSLNWLNSLKERHLWKPSEEQMKALAQATVPDDCLEAYETLWHDLNNLRKTIK